MKNNEGNSAMAEGKCNSLTNIESLPDELVFNILLHLPAQDIYDSAMLVCRRWSNIIHTRQFIYEHLHHSTPGLIAYSPDHGYIAYLTIRQGRIEISKLSDNFKGFSRASSNGLILECELDENYTPYISNPATKQRLSLLPDYYSGIAYAATSMVYKVVCTYYSRDNPDERGCHIMTVGVDKFERLVDTKHLSPEAKKVLLGLPLLTTDGFVHWTNKLVGTHVVTLNIETEVVTETQIPQGYEKRWKYYLSTGNSLTFFTDINGFSWEIWELREETGEWTKLPNIDVEMQIRKFERLCDCCRSRPSSRFLKPVGWLNYREALVLQVLQTHHCIVYNIGTREIELFDLDHDINHYDFVVHRNSLVGLGGFLYKFSH